MQQRDKMVRDSVYTNSQQLIQLSNTLKDQSGFIMRLKSQLAEMKTQQEDAEMQHAQEMLNIQSRLEVAEQEIMKK